MASFCESEQVDERQECCEEHKDDIELDSDDESGHNSSLDDDCTSGDSKLPWLCRCVWSGQ